MDWFHCLPKERGPEGQVRTSSEVRGRKTKTEVRGIGFPESVPTEPGASAELGRLLINQSHINISQGKHGSYVLQWLVGNDKLWLCLVGVSLHVDLLDFLSSAGAWRGLLYRVTRWTDWAGALLDWAEIFF
jgi:hypothetical protein